MNRTRRPVRSRATAVAAAAGLLAGASLLAACADPEDGVAPPLPATEGSPEQGRALIVDYGCASCHTVPGIDQADGLVGPPLTAFGRRTYIAGQLSNSEEHLQEWIKDPQEYAPGTAMPDLGVTDDDAADITAYLLSLR